MSSIRAHNSEAACFLSFLTKILYKFITSMHVTCPLYSMRFNHTNGMNEEYP
jgi:hypothetical protein